MAILNRLLPPTIAFAFFTTACTAIVLGQFGDTDDYAKNDAGRSSSSSGTSGTSGDGGDEQVGECDLRFNSEFSKPSPVNACSECITTKCQGELAEACEPDGGKAIAGFSNVKSCAKSPYETFGPSGAGASWSCEPFLDAGDPISGSSESAKRRSLERCVGKCLQGGTPECKLCEVSTVETGTDNLRFLKDDKCGKCLVTGCPDVLVECCDSQAVKDFVVPCAFTEDGTNKTLCRENNNRDPNGGTGRFPSSKSQYGDAGYACLNKLNTCWKLHCETVPDCK